jgi:DNA-binding NtrC family response regulator
LRDRLKDVLILARHFIREFCSENNIPLKKLTEQSQKKLMNYSYPGNVRELKSIVELAVTLSGKEEIEPSDLVLDPGESSDLTDNADYTLRDYELIIIKRTLKKFNNDIRLAASKLDIGVSTIYRLLKEEKG